MYAKTFLVALLAATVSAAAVDISARQNNNNNNNKNNNNNNNNNNNAGAAAGANAAADFGQCNPTMDFQLGRAGRKADEGTFLPVDPLVAQGQQDALNPAIIANRICDQLTNVCEANQAAKDLCTTAQGNLGTAKDQSTADAFNAALGF